MGNSNISKYHTSDTVIKDALDLKSFFNKYYNSPEKLELLKYVPIAINYNISYKFIAQDNSLFGFDSPRFYKPQKSLSYQLQCRFCDGCKIIISKEYNKKLINFSKETKTSQKILNEYYKQTKIEQPEVKQSKETIR